MKHLTWCGVLLPLLGASALSAEEPEWQRIGPPVGTIGTVAVDPNEGTVYAGGYAGLFRSRDGGRAWQPLAVRDPLTVAFSEHGAIYVGSSGGAYLSTDGGRSFDLIDELNGQFVTSIVTDPFDDQVAYAANSRGVFESTDGGMTWELEGGAFPPPYGPALLVADPNTPGVLYALVAEHILKSTDGAATWRDSGTGLPDDCGIAYQLEEGGSLFHTCLLSIAIAAAPATTLYVGTDGRGLYRSSDGGETWEPLGGEIGDRAVLSIAVDPQAADVLLAGVADAHDPQAPDPFDRTGVDRTGGTIFRSDDGGVFWRETNRGVPEIPVVAIAIEPSLSDNHRTEPGATRVYAATAGAGVLASADGGETWQPAERGLDAACLRDVAAVPTMPTTLVVATGESPPTLLFTDDGGSTWLDADVEPALAQGLTVDPNEPGVVYADTLLSELIKSADGGRTWAGRDPGFAVFDLAIDPASPTLLYAACGSCGVMKSTDGGETWLDAGEGLPSISQVAVEEGSGTVYAVAEGVGFKSTDGGNSWVEIAPVPRSLFATLVVAPAAPPALFALTLEGIFTSRDGGESWQESNPPGVDGSTPLLIRVAVSPVDPNTVYALVNHQLFRSDDAGREWVPVGPPLEHSANGFAVDPNDPEVVYAATCGSSLVALRQEGAVADGSGNGGCALVTKADALGPALFVPLFLFALASAAKRLRDRSERDARE